MLGQETAAFSSTAIVVAEVNGVELSVTVTVPLAGPIDGVAVVVAAKAAPGATSAAAASRTRRR